MTLDPDWGIQSSTSIPGFSFVKFLLRLPNVHRTNGTDAWVPDAESQKFGSDVFHLDVARLSDPAAFPFYKWMSDPIKSSFIEPLIGFLGSPERRLRRRLIGKRFLDEGKAFSVSNLKKAKSHVLFLQLP